MQRFQNALGRILKVSHDDMKEAMVEDEKIRGAGPGKNPITLTQLPRVPRPSSAWAGFLMFTRYRLNLTNKNTVVPCPGD
jgi:hypothetical protein